MKCLSFAASTETTTVYFARIFGSNDRRRDWDSDAHSDSREMKNRVSKKKCRYSISLMCGVILATGTNCYSIVCEDQKILEKNLAFINPNTFFKSISTFKI